MFVSMLGITCKIQFLMYDSNAALVLLTLDLFHISAGSLGALIHADRLRERLPSSVKTLHLLVDGGLFVDVPDINNDHTMGNLLRDVFYFHHAHSKETVAVVASPRRTLWGSPYIGHYTFDKCIP